MPEYELESNEVDLTAQATRGLVGVIPLAGPILAEIVNSLIPNQRLDRACRFLEELNERLSLLEQESLRKNELAIDLFEDATIIASRSFSMNRNQYIASFIKSSVNVTSNSYELKKKLLFILQDLTDRDVEILKNIREKSYSKVFSEIFVDRFTSQWHGLSENEKNEYKIMQKTWPLHISILERHGLLNVGKNTDNLFSAISDLGRLFLSSVIDGHDSQ